MEPLVAIASYDEGSYDIASEMTKVRSLLENADIETTTISWIYVHADKVVQARKILARAIAKDHLHVTLVRENDQPGEQASAETPLQELDASISAASEKIASLKAALPALNDRLKKAEAEFEKKPKPPTGYRRLCPDPSISEADSALRRNKEEFAKVESQLAELKKLRARSAGKNPADTSGGVQAPDNSITLTPDLMGKSIVDLLKQKAASRPVVPASDAAPAPTKISPETMAASLREWKTLKPGRSTRADVLKIFSVTGGGVGDATMRTYGYRDSPNILVDATFEVPPLSQEQSKKLSPEDTLHLAWAWSPTDKLISVSTPYLGALPLD
jgi:hypothetical protein